MYCEKCGTYITDKNSKYCYQCGSKTINDGVIISISNNNIEKNKANIFLILGIVEAFLFSKLFGLAVIILNEMKYKPELKKGLTAESNNTKKLMIVLLCVGAVVGIIITILYFILALSD